MASSIVLPGQTIAASNLNPHACVVSNNASLTLTNTVERTLTWNTEESDNGGMFTATSDTITLQRDGIYAVKAAIQADLITGGALGGGLLGVLTLLQNSTEIAEHGYYFGNTSIYRWIITADVVGLSGDTIKCTGYQSSGFNRTTSLGRMSVVQIANV